MTPRTASCRLYVILARDGRSAVVFRRGPTRHVAVFKWWLASDAVELGQWFHGRIYERRCDLSPDGELLVYFAATYRAPLSSWTAVSRPPFLTALALWPNGSGWGGGGMFASSLDLGLNHHANQLVPAPGSTSPAQLKISQYAEYAGHGEDDPICHDRMLRDGWICVATGRQSRYRTSGAEHWTFEEPEVYERPQPRHAARHKSRGAPQPTVLRRELHGIGVRNGAWYREIFTLCDTSATMRTIPHCDWADWDNAGNLLFAARGTLYRLDAHSAGQGAAEPENAARVIADLNPLKFEPIEPPGAARKWPAFNRNPVQGRRIAP